MPSSTTKRQTRSSQRNVKEVDAALGLTSLSSPSASTENSDDDVPKKKKTENEKKASDNNDNVKEDEAKEDTSPAVKTTDGDDAVKEETKTEPEDFTEDNNNIKPSSSADSAAPTNNNDNSMKNNMMGGPVPYGASGYPPGGFDPAMMHAQNAAGNNGDGFSPSAAGAYNNTQKSSLTRTTNTKNFPETLFAVISDKENDHIISWLPHGKGFIIHDKNLFGTMILPRYFDGAKFTSFTRRLKRWAFVRVPRGPELGAYYNTYFQRDKPDWVEKMRYRMEESQFSEASSKDGMSEQGKQFARQLRNEVERDAERYAAQRKRIEDALAANMMTDSFLTRPSPFGEDEMYARQLKYALASKISSETKRHFQLEGNRPMPLPSTLPRRTKETRNLVLGGAGYTGNTESDDLRMMEMQREIMMGQRTNLDAHNDPYMFGYGGSMMLGPTSSSARYGVPGGSAFPSSNPTDRMSESEIGDRIKQYQRVLGIGGSSAAGMMDYQSGYPMMGNQYSMPMGGYNTQMNPPEGSPKEGTAGGDEAQAVIMSKEDKEEYEK